MMMSQFPAAASGVTVSLSDGVGTVDAGSGGSTEITTSWTSSGIYATNSTLTITVSPATQDTITNCATVDCNFFSSAIGCDISFATSTMTSSTATGTFTQSVATSTAGGICLTYPISATSVQNYSVAVLTSGGSTSDFGAALYYVLGANQVTVTATVPATLSFAIRNSADTANTNTCALGVLSTTAVSSCSYRLRIATNATNGFNSTILADLDFNSNGNATMTNIVNDTAFAAGTEAYGISTLTAADSGVRSATSGLFVAGIVESGIGAGYATTTFNTDTSPVPTTTGAVLFVYATSAVNPEVAPSLTDTTLVTHSAAISAGTESGAYTQTVTYRVTGSF
ncbi:MAG TPA: hypothetical protein VN397_04030 [Candidatus Methylomirabilis sp.]|nr:hypothetical protein [Candidatus Methylomirabilis sp.]